MKTESKLQTKLYLITGFLGAGKTSFLQRFVKLFPDKKIAIIVNEFGKTGMDGTLLRDLGVRMTEINNGSIFCACKVEQFEAAVQMLLLEKQPDLIFVEASGLADPSAVRAIFSRDCYEGMEYAGAICLVDALRFHKIYETARVCRMQLAISDMVLINKCDLASREQIDRIREIALAQKPHRPVRETSFGAFEAAWLEELCSPGFEGGDGSIHARDISLQKLSVRVSGFSRGQMEAFLKMFAEDTYRVKGFVTLAEGMFAVDCVGPLVELRPFSGKTENPDLLTVLYGHGLTAKKSLREAASHFPDCTAEIEK